MQLVPDTPEQSSRACLHIIPNNSNSVEADIGVFAILVVAFVGSIVESNLSEPLVSTLVIKDEPLVKIGAHFHWDCVDKSTKHRANT